MFNNKKTFCDIFPFLFKKNFTQATTLMGHSKKQPSLINNRDSILDNDQKDKIISLDYYERKKKERKNILQNIILEITSNNTKVAPKKAISPKKESDFYKSLYSTSDDEDEELEESIDANEIISKTIKTESFKEISKSLRNEQSYLISTDEEILLNKRNFSQSETRKSKSINYKPYKINNDLNKVSDREQIFKSNKSLKYDLYEQNYNEIIDDNEEMREENIPGQIKPVPEKLKQKESLSRPAYEHEFSNHDDSDIVEEEEDNDRFFNSHYDPLFEKSSKKTHQI